MIDRPCLRLLQRGKQVAYAPSLHSEAKLDCVYVYLPIFPARPPSVGWVDIGFLLPSLNYGLRTFWPTPLATLPTLTPLSGPGPCPSLPPSLGSMPTTRDEITTKPATDCSLSMFLKSISWDSLFKFMITEKTFYNQQIVTDLPLYIPTTMSTSKNVHAWYYVEKHKIMFVRVTIAGIIFLNYLSIVSINMMLSQSYMRPLPV